eukprot:5267157-Prymnesium_polylepis.2
MNRGRKFGMAARKLASSACTKLSSLLPSVVATPVALQASRQHGGGGRESPHGPAQYTARGRADAGQAVPTGW